MHIDCVCMCVHVCVVRVLCVCVCVCVRARAHAVHAVNMYTLYKSMASCVLVHAQVII